MTRKGKEKVSEEPVVQSANSKNSNNDSNLSPTGLALRLSRMNMIQRNQNPNVGASTNVTKEIKRKQSAQKFASRSSSPRASPRASPKPPPKSSKKTKLSLKNFLEGEPFEERIVGAKPTQLAILVIHNDAGKRVRPNTIPGKP